MPRHPPIALTTLDRSHCQCSSLSRRFVRNDRRIGLPFTIQSTHDAIDVFDRSALLELRRAARLQSVIKTSFSRSNPVPRGQATVIRSSVRSAPKDANNEGSRVTSFPPTSNPSPISGRLGHRKVHRERSRTFQVKNPKHLEASRSIFSSQCMQNRHQAEADANFFPSKDILVFAHAPKALR